MKKIILLSLSLCAVFSFASAQNNCRLYTNEVAAPDGIKVAAKTLKQYEGNLYDMSWLDKAVKGKRMVMIGESHWMTSVHQTAKSIVFHLNNTDSFPVLIREIPFSVTPFMNAYINCETGNCDELLTVLKPYVGSQEEQNFLKELQKWNSEHPNKKITIACSDFEQGFQFPLRNVLHPYFTQQGHTNFKERLMAANNDLDLVFTYIDSLLQQSPESFHVAGKPYLNKTFATQVIDNLKAYANAEKSRQLAQHAGKSAAEASTAYFNVRGESIKNNLTDEARFGKLLKENKSILWGGAAHTIKYKFDAQDKEAFEGSFLCNEYEPTKGKVLSVKVMAMSYDIPEAYYTGDTYKYGVAQFEKLVEAYKNCNTARAAGTYRMIEQTTEVTNAITAKFKDNSNQPVWLAGNSEMNKLLKKAPHLKEDSQLRSFYAYDYVVVLPHTRLYTRLN
ncbi:TraB/GumN family protein [Pontibacter cellulosilyticus]|uniref:Erythromycin esterase family protein n=1 Tax=Pontibacter cellulosilyticus TaxID=1720253 RepID=A0A923NAX6_9BACT|nr:hypothetical protein [Pontibacter cellulosilyticus]MBC5995052.1 hypothetical protein [Pontibacter cellulosilyticus]